VLEHEIEADMIFFDMRVVHPVSTDSAHKKRLAPVQLKSIGRRNDDSMRLTTF
jgi:hypothetical protein